MVAFKSLDTVSYSHFIVTMALFCIISEIKRDIGQKSRFFHNCRRMVWLSDCAKSLMMQRDRTSCD